MKAQNSIRASVYKKNGLHFRDGQCGQVHRIIDALVSGLVYTSNFPKIYNSFDERTERLQKMRLFIDSLRVCFLTKNNNKITVPKNP